MIFDRNENKEDIAEAGEFLLGKHAGFITGNYTARFLYQKRYFYIRKNYR